VYDAGVASTFPAASIERTRKVCVARETYAFHGEVHAPKAPPSSEHSDVVPLSEATNQNVAVRDDVVEAGPLVRRVSGAKVSTVH